MQQGKVDLCLVGSDRTAMNGDVCNKIGTYLKAIAAHQNKVPFYVALPKSTIDKKLAKGVNMIEIEHRDANELTDLNILIQYEDAASLGMIKSDYGLTELEIFPSIKTAVYSVLNTQQINETVTALSNDPRVVNVSFNLVEMTEVTE